MWILIKNTNHQYLGLEAKIEKSKTTLLSQTFEVAENKVPFVKTPAQLSETVLIHCLRQ